MFKPKHGRLQTSVFKLTMPLTRFGNKVFDSKLIVSADHSSWITPADKIVVNCWRLTLVGQHLPVEYRDDKDKFTYDAIEAWMNELPNPLKKQ